MDFLRFATTITKQLYKLMGLSSSELKIYWQNELKKNTRKMTCKYIEEAAMTFVLY